MTNSRWGEAGLGGFRRSIGSSLRSCPLVISGRSAASLFPLSGWWPLVTEPWTNLEPVIISLRRIRTKKRCSPYTIPVFSSDAAQASNNKRSPVNVGPLTIPRSDHLGIQVRRGPRLSFFEQNFPRARQMLLGLAFIHVQALDDVSKAFPHDQHILFPEFFMRILWKQHKQARVIAWFDPCKSRPRSTLPRVDTCAIPAHDRCFFGLTRAKFPPMISASSGWYGRKPRPRSMLLRVDRILSQHVHKPYSSTRVQYMSDMGV